MYNTQARITKKDVIQIIITQLHVNKVYITVIIIVIYFMIIDNNHRPDYVFINYHFDYITYLNNQLVIYRNPFITFIIIINIVIYIFINIIMKIY